MKLHAFHKMSGGLRLETCETGVTQGGVRFPIAFLNIFQELLGQAQNFFLDILM
jgi:hypothetical protein